jgi:predicted nuclease of predicted toxin-antitoxin system
MRLLLDECVPRQLARGFAGHDVHTVAAMGWSGKHNGELLRLMVAGQFECLVTADQNFAFQQNVSASTVSILVLVARRNRLKELQPLMPKALDALANLKAGQIVQVEP